jgi:hypothetical protein
LEQDVPVVFGNRSPTTERMASLPYRTRAWWLGNDTPNPASASRPCASCLLAVSQEESTLMCQWATIASRQLRRFKASFSSSLSFKKTLTGLANLVIPSCQLSGIAISGWLCCENLGSAAGSRPAYSNRRTAPIHNCMTWNIQDWTSGSATSLRSQWVAHYSAFPPYLLMCFPQSKILSNEHSIRNGIMGRNPGPDLCIKGYLRCKHCRLQPWAHVEQASIATVS